MIKSAKEAKEILTAFDKEGRLAGTGPKIGEAMGYLAALEGPEVKALVERLQKERSCVDVIGEGCSLGKDCETCKVLREYQRAAKP